MRFLADVTIPLGHSNCGCSAPTHDAGHHRIGNPAFKHSCAGRVAVPGAITVVLFGETLTAIGPVVCGGWDAPLPPQPARKQLQASAIAPKYLADKCILFSQPFKASLDLERLS